MNTNLITDKIVIYFVAAIAIVGVLVGTYFLISLVNIQNQHVLEEEAAQKSIDAIDNITELIVSNQRIILENQNIDRNISETIDVHLKSMSYSPENNKLLKEILNILNSSTKTTTP